MTTSLIMHRIESMRRGRISVQSEVQSTLDRIAGRNETVNAFTRVLATRALAQAAALDVKIAEGHDPGPLTGLCFAAKDLFDVAGKTTLAGSVIWRDKAPARRDAFAIRQLEAAGAVLVGTLNMDEFASGFTTENTHYGATRNPHDPTRTAGGSSGGSAAAIAAGMVPLTLASDTNGSIRVPSACCGVFGLKPTYGRLSRAGTTIFAESFDHVGPIACDPEVLAVAYEVLQGPDPDDPVQAFPPAVPTSSDPLRIAKAGGAFFDFCDSTAQATTARAAEALGVTATLDLPGIEAGWSAAVVITLVEGADIHIDDLRRAPQDFDPMTRDRFLAGALVPTRAYLAAQRARRQWHARALQAFAETDVLITPALPFAPTLLGSDTIDVSGQTVNPRGALGQFTQPFSCIGFPAMVVPLAKPNGDADTLPRAVQLVAPPWHEDRLFATAQRLVDAGLASSHILS